MILKHDRAAVAFEQMLYIPLTPSLLPSLLTPSFPHSLLSSVRPSNRQSFQPSFPQYFRLFTLLLHHHRPFLPNTLNTTLPKTHSLLRPSSLLPLPSLPPSRCYTSVAPSFRVSVSRSPTHPPTHQPTFFASFLLPFPFMKFSVQPLMCAEYNLRVSAGWRKRISTDQV